MRKRRLKHSLEGKRFGRWLVIDYAGRGHCSLWNCVCDCGTTRSVRSDSLLNGTSVSCGCFQAEMSVVANTKPTDRPVALSDTPVYKIWVGMRQRCQNPNDPSYVNYGFRGIKVCDEWNTSFESFSKYIGPRPSSNHSIGRINNDGDYTPGNVRWETPSQQAVNRRTTRNVTIGGKTLPITRMAKLYGIAQSTISSRLGNGWSVEPAFITPIDKRYSHGKNRRNSLV